MADAIVLIDKPEGITSHDAVARTRRAFGTRKVGHAGTLDPMATGLLVLGVEGATRLLTYLVGLDKTYTATIRLGQATTTDDREGEVTMTAVTAELLAVPDAAILTSIDALTGEIDQVPSSVSAIKVDGKRAYDRVRAGEDVELASRRVTIKRFEVLALRRSPEAIELDVVVDCTSGTYIRALARDLGSALGIGGHLTALRRTHVGPFAVTEAVAIDALSPELVLSPAVVAERAIGAITVTAEEAVDLRHGKRIAAAGRASDAPHIAAIAPDGSLIGVVAERDGAIKSIMNMPERKADAQ